MHGCQDIVSLRSGYLIQLKFTWREFSGTLVVRTWHSLQWPLGSIPGLGTNIPQTSRCGQKKFVHEKPQVIFFFFWLKERSPTKVGVHLSLIGNHVNVKYKDVKYKAIKKAERRRIDAFKLWCWRRLLRVPWTAKRSNQSILREISPEYSLEGLILKLKLQYFGHLLGRADSSEKTLMLGKIGGRI